MSAKASWNTRQNQKADTKKKDVLWFALNDERPLFDLASTSTEFKGDRGTKSKSIPGPHGFLATALNAVMEPIRLKAMPLRHPAL
jgi:hypothetical protein